MTRLHGLPEGIEVCFKFDSIFERTATSRIKKRHARCRYLTQTESLLIGIKPEAGFPGKDRQAKGHGLQIGEPLTFVRRQEDKCTGFTQLILILLWCVLTVDHLRG